MFLENFSLLDKKNIKAKFFACFSKKTDLAFCPEKTEILSKFLKENWKLQLQVTVTETSFEVLMAKNKFLEDSLEAIVLLLFN